MELPTTIAECHEVIRQLSGQVSQLNQQLQTLTARLNQHSGNSSKPPSSDGPGTKPKKDKDKKKKKSYKERLGRKPRGGQKGHKGKSLEMVATPDHIQEDKPDQCSCGASLEQADFTLIDRRQVFELPEPRLEVTEYSAYECQCPNCGQRAAGSFPTTANAPVQYGPRVKALVTLLLNKHHLSHQRTGELFCDLFGYRINDHTQQRIQQQAYERLNDFEQALKEALQQAAVGHADETSMRMNAGLRWLHDFSTDKLTYVFSHPKRGLEAMRSPASVLPDFKGLLIHDCLSSYFTFKDSEHALCGAHLFRELEAQREQGAEWAEKMQDLLLTLKAQADQGQALKKGSKYWRAYDTLCRQADDYEPPPEPSKRGRPKKSKGRNLMERLVKYKEEVLRFALQPGVPFTNNQAERDIRPAKVKQKNAGCFRTEAGLQWYARIYSFLSTMRKQQRQVFDELTNLFNGQAVDVAVC